MGFRYIGSKDRLADVIISEINSLDINVKRVIDLMAGTGLLSRALRTAGYKVTAVDVMTYSFHHLNVFLHFDTEPSFSKVSLNDNSGYEGQQSLFAGSKYQELLEHLNHLTPQYGYFFTEFSPEGNPRNTTRPRKYFTAENAGKIDAIRDEIRNLRETKQLTELEHSLLIHDLIMASNDVANIAGTYGHYLSKIIERAKEPIVLKPTTFIPSGNASGHKIYRAYAEDVAALLDGDVCYIDPPYIKRQYAANYHVLETLAREDCPEAIGESGLRPWRDQYSNFCSKVKIRGSFDKILTSVKSEHFLISYSEDGLVPIDELMSFLGEYGAVRLKSIKYKRFKSNEGNKGGSLDEFLIHLARN